MNGALLAAGAVKLFIGIGLGGLGVVLVYRLLSRILDTKNHPLTENAAAGVVHATALLSLGILARQSLTSLYDTLDLVLLRGDVLQTLPKVIFLGVMHVGLALVLGSLLLGLGVWLFNVLTPGIDEVAEVKNGKLGPALVLGAILITFAMLAAPGLEALLSGLVPYPALPDGLGIPTA